MSVRVCVNCNKRLRPHKTGAIAVELYEDRTTPYLIWSCDLWRCSNCENTIACGFGNVPIRRDFDRDFYEWVNRADLTFF